MMKTYKWLRGVLKASAFAAVMFVMQACYGAPQPFEDPNYNDEEETYQPTDTLQLDQQAPVEAEAAE